MKVGWQGDLTPEERTEVVDLLLLSFAACLPGLGLSQGEAERQVIRQLEAAREFATLSAKQRMWLWDRFRFYLHVVYHFPP